MERCFLASLSLLLYFGTMTNLMAQEIKGVLIDSISREKIESAVVLLQDKDEKVLDNTISNEVGEFLFPVHTNASYIVVQHIGYEIKRSSLQSESGFITILLSPKSSLLNEIVVKGERPAVKLRDNSLIYSPQSIVERFSPTTALELLLNVPGVVRGAAGVSLLGANRTMVIIDGKTTRYAEGEILTILSSLSPNQIKNIEISYNAPAKYRFNGAVINIETFVGRQDDYSIFLKTGAQKDKYFSENFSGSGVWSNKKIALLASLGADHDEQYSRVKHDSYLNSLYSPFWSRAARTKSVGNSGKLSLEFTYNMSDKNNISINYYGLIDKSNKIIHTESEDILANQKTGYQTQDLSRKNLHNIGVNTNLHNTNLGFKYLIYNAPSFLSHGKNSSENSHQVIMEEQNSKLNINNVEFFFNQKLPITPSFNIEIGTNYSRNNSLTTIAENGHELRGKLFEDIIGGSVEVSFRMFKRLSVNLGTRLEYSTARKKEEQHLSDKNLWSEFTAFPTATIGMPFGNRNFVQLMLNSQKNLPPYWALAPYKTVIDANSLSVGNPDLRPSREYNGQIFLSLRQKYIFILGCTYTPRYFAIIPHYDQTTNKYIYKFENYTYSLFNNLSTIIPFSIGRNFNTRLSAHLLRMQDRIDDFYDIDVNNKKWVFSFALNNSFSVPFAKSKLVLDLNYRYQSPSIQGVYELTTTHALDMGVRYLIGSKFSLQAGVSNILCRTSPHQMQINLPGQMSIMYPYNNQKFYLGLTLNLGKKKDIKESAIDFSRLNKTYQ